MSRVTVEVGAASQQQIQIPRDIDVLANERRVVIRVKCFDRVETGLRQRRDPPREAELTWMRERRNAAGLVDHVHHRLRCWALTGDAAWAPVAEPAVERLLGVGDMPSLNHGPGDLRPTDRPTALEGGLPHQRIKVHGYAQRRKAGADRLDARDSRLARRQQKHAKCLVLRIEQVTKHMEISALLYRSDLDATYRLDVGCTRRCANLSNGRRRVVIGHGHYRHTRSDGARNKFLGRTPAVGCGGVKMEINHEEASPGRPGGTRMSPRVVRRARFAPRRATGSALALEQRPVLPNQKVKVLPLFVGEF